MAVVACTTQEQTRFSVHHNIRTVRATLRRLKQSELAAEVCFLGRRSPERMLDHVERRVCSRSPVQVPIYVTEVTFDGSFADLRNDGVGTIMAVTKDVSLRGLGFTHDEPLESDYVITTFDLLNSGPVSLLLEVRWSNIRRGYAFLTGGRFRGITDDLAL